MDYSYWWSHLFTDKEDRQSAVLELFSKKKQELDTQLAVEEELQNKLKKIKIDNIVDDFFQDMGWTRSIILKKQQKKRLFHFDQLDIETGKLKSNLGAVDVDKEMKSSVLKPGFEKEHSLPSYFVSDKKLKALRKVLLILSYQYINCTN